MQAVLQEGAPHEVTGSSGHGGVHLNGHISAFAFIGEILRSIPSDDVRPDIIEEHFPHTGPEHVKRRDMAADEIGERRVEGLWFGPFSLRGMDQGRSESHLMCVALHINRPGKLAACWRLQALACAIRECTLRSFALPAGYIGMKATTHTRPSAYSGGGRRLHYRHRGRGAVRVEGRAGPRGRRATGTSQSSPMGRPRTKTLRRGSSASWNGSIQS